MALFPFVQATPRQLVPDWQALASAHCGLGWERVQQSSAEPRVSSEQEGGMVGAEFAKTPAKMLVTAISSPGVGWRAAGCPFGGCRIGRAAPFALDAGKTISNADKHDKAGQMCENIATNGRKTGKASFRERSWCRIGRLWRRPTAAWGGREFNSLQRNRECLRSRREVW